MTGLGPSDVGGTGHHAEPGHRRQQSGRQRVGPESSAELLHQWGEGEVEEVHGRSHSEDAHQRGLGPEQLEALTQSGERTGAGRNLGPIDRAYRDGQEGQQRERHEPRDDQEGRPDTNGLDGRPSDQRAQRQPGGRAHRLERHGVVDPLGTDEFVDHRTPTGHVEDPSDAHDDHERVHHHQLESVGDARQAERSRQRDDGEELGDDCGSTVQTVGDDAAHHAAHQQRRPHGHPGELDQTS